MKTTISLTCALLLVGSTAIAGPGKLSPAVREMQNEMMAMDEPYQEIAPSVMDEEPLDSLQDEVPLLKQTVPVKISARPSVDSTVPKPPDNIKTDAAVRIQPRLRNYTAPPATNNLLKISSAPAPQAVAPVIIQQRQPRLRNYTAPPATGNNLFKSSFSTAQQAVASVMPCLDADAMVRQVVDSIPDEWRNEIGKKLVEQNLALLYQGKTAASRIRVQVRGRILQDRFNTISGIAPNVFRGNIQPAMVQNMVTNINPWQFPGRFKNNMMPNMVKQISSQIKMPQIQYMQENIESAAFPNISGVPAGMADAMSGQVKQQQMQFMQKSTMDSSFPKPIGSR